jgi:signal transduction histidine kinase
VIWGVVAVIAGAEWLHSGGAVAAWAWVCGVGGAIALLVALRQPRSAERIVAGVATFTLGAVLVGVALQVRQIECCWVRVREGRVTRASRALNAALKDVVDQTEVMVTAAAAAAQRPRAEAFVMLDRLVGRAARGLERGIVLYDPAGRAWAWAGRHRRLPAPDGPELSASITPFYASLEARRQTTGGGVAVGTALLSAAPAATDTTGALATTFGRAHGVTLRFWSPATAPNEADLFDYTTAAGDTILSVEPVPPAQGDAKLDALRRAALWGAAALGLAVLGLLLAAPPGVGRWSVLLGTAWAALRAGPELVPLFSPATYYRGALGVFGQSAGALGVAGFVATVGAAVLWRRGVRRRPRSIAVAALLVLATPYLLRYCGRGISPPATGVGFGLWVSWQAAIALTAAALVLTAAALVRGTTEPRRVPWVVPAACVWAVIAALAGLWLWLPRNAWPEWYTFAWLPALIGVMVPAPRRWAAAGTAVVAGTAAALLTWGATLDGRLALAARDVGGLGGQGDAMAVALLEKLGQRVERRAPPRSASALYGVWLGSPLAARDYPALLALWEPDGGRIAELRLADLDLPPPLLAALARSNPAIAGTRVERLERLNGVHWVLVVPFPTGEVLTVGVGPRTALVKPERLARFLRGDARVEAPYEISLSLPRAENAPGPGPFWHRTGWTARADRLATFPDGPHHVYVRVDLGSPPELGVRGMLVVLLDVALVAFAWLMGRIVTEGWRPRVPATVWSGRASYRTRLTAALVAFIVGPMIIFAIWSFARLRDEARRAGDLLIGQTLRDAAVTAGPLTSDQPASLGTAVTELGQRLDADLWLYSDGVLAGTAPSVLGELALVDPLLDPDVFRRLALEDELELTTDGRTAGRPIRVGYRLVSAGPEARNVLAAPQLLDDERVRRQSEDLALVLLAASLAGLGAAVLLAGFVARSLARPVGALRDAATAIGQGAQPPPFPERAPPEFAPVFTAFDRMAHDIRRSQAAVEAARERTARVLANVATGVIAVDDALRVTLANPRAAELLGAALRPGDELPRVAGREWSPVWDELKAVIARAPADIAARDFEVDGRQIRAQFASLGSRPDGCVVALDDTTAIARAARVLAWGEMARQVAHEIKNPLTPIRLGIQHLQRAQRSRGKAEFESMLDETAQRILVEIDRLDAIARAFSRFGAPADPQPLEAVDLLATANEVAQLYALGGQRGGARVTVEGDAGLPVQARRDEVKEVLLNLLENARNAGAKRIVVRVGERGGRVQVTDDGPGIPADVLARLFEPRFQTTSSGAGLGLAIARRLVESWGGSIAVTSEPGQGTTVTVSFRQHV